MSRAPHGPLDAVAVALEGRFGAQRHGSLDELLGRGAGVGVLAPAPTPAPWRSAPPPDALVLGADTGTLGLLRLLDPGPPPAPGGEDAVVADTLRSALEGAEEARAWLGSRPDAVARDVHVVALVQGAGGPGEARARVGAARVEVVRARPSLASIGVSVVEWPDTGDPSPVAIAAGFPWLVAGEVVRRLGAELEARYGVVRCAALAECLQGAHDVALVHPVQALVARHFVPRFHALVYDRRLGTLGLVRVLESGLVEPDGVAPTDALEEEVKSAIDDATYVRHLLQIDPQLGERKAVSVELVLASHQPGDGEPISRRIGDALRDLARDRRYLKSIGVNLVRSGDDEALFGKDVARAFPWLLRRTSEWYTKWFQDPRPEVGAAHALRGLTLEGYRTRRRTMSLGDGRLHIVHGLNGTGKSMIAEAFELVLTGDIERLKGANVLEVVRYRGGAPGSEPTTPVIHLERGGSAAPERYEVVDLVPTRAQGQDADAAVDEPRHTLRPRPDIPAELRAAAFRLNQDVMNRLASADTAVRAETFMKAYFPGDAAGTLRTAEVAHGAVGDADERIRAIVRQLGLARATLERCRTWTPGGRAVIVDDRGDRVNRWLHATALRAFGERCLETMEFASRVADGGFEDEAGISAFLAGLDPTAIDHDELRSILEDWERTSDRPPAPERAASLPEPAQRGDGAKARSIAPLTDHERSALDAVTKWIFVEDVKSFGAAIREALLRDQITRFGPLDIGRDGWTDEPIERLRYLETTWESRRRIPADSPWSWPEAARELSELEQLTEARAVESKAGKEVVRAFQTHLGPLNEALNEMISLFTPARWGYEPISVDEDVRIKSGNDEGEGDSARVDLRWNTAELNLFTLALFLLCSFRESNRFRLLILDDPLQNMDELTVATLARGVSKLLRLWGAQPGLDAWKLLLLLHGEGNVEAFAREAEATVYQIPWVSPARSGHDDTIPIVYPADGRGPDAVQELGSVFAPR